VHALPWSIIELTRKANPPAEGKHARPPIVGIGASAGGIDALNSFFGSMPADSGLAFAVVLHLDPPHHSELASLLGRRTAIAIRSQVSDEPAKVYQAGEASTRFPARITGSVRMRVTGTLQASWLSSSSIPKTNL
jgi:chemotaxis response regulator CheB